MAGVSVICALPHRANARGAGRYSTRGAVIGSIRAVRRAGSQPASRQTAIRARPGELRRRHVATFAIYRAFPIRFKCSRPAGVNR